MRTTKETASVLGPEKERIVEKGGISAEKDELAQILNFYNYLFICLAEKLSDF
jgi:hypothetical protein